MNLQYLALAAAIAAAGCTSIVTVGDGGSKAANVGLKKTTYAMKADRRYIPPSIENGELVMPFFEHVFSSYCFNTQRCRVLYKNRYDTDEQIPSGPLSEDIRKNLDGSWIGIDNFPPPARVTWTSKDGGTHVADIDIGEIFRSQRVRYASDLNVKDVDLGVYPLPPAIILVVEDRSIHVYMKAHISLLHPINPRNKYSNFREDLVVAYTQTF